MRDSEVLEGAPPGERLEEAAAADEAAVVDDRLADDAGAADAGVGLVPARSVAMRVVGVLALVLTAWHLFASFLWIAPVTPLREVVPGNVLTSYMIPFFGQSWSVFAPAPINGDFHLKVRALVGEGGQETETEWVDAAQVEVQGMHIHNLFPPRASTAGLQQASALKLAHEGLGSEQQRLVAQNYFEGVDWKDRLQYDMAQVDSVPAAEEYLKIEERTSAYATQVARAVWGKDVQRVQFQVIRQNVIPFEERHTPGAERPGEQVVDTGWRGPVDLPGQSNDRFAEVFTPLYESYRGEAE